MALIGESNKHPDMTREEAERRAPSDSGKGGEGG